MKKRTWIYIYPPSHYEICCNRDRKHKIAWSEYKGRIWCYKCKKDIKVSGGMFDGPINLQVCKLILGSNCFNRWDLNKKCELTMIHRNDKIFYRKKISRRTATHGAKK